MWWFVFVRIVVILQKCIFIIIPTPVVVICLSFHPQLKLLVERDLKLQLRSINALIVATLAQSNPRSLHEPDFSYY